MALAKQTTSLALVRGLSVKQDRKLMQGGLLTLENGVFTSPGKIAKRNGYTSLGQGILGDPVTTVEAGRALMSYRDELLLADGRKLYSYAEGADAWVSKGAYVPVGVSSRPVVRDTHEQTHPDGNIHEETGIALYAWQDSRGGSYYTVIDQKTGQTVVSATQISANSFRPKVLCLGDRLIVLTYESGDQRLYQRTLRVGSPTLGLSTPEPLTSTAGSFEFAKTDGWFDATVSGDVLYLAYRSQTGGTSIRAFHRANLGIVYGEDHITTDSLCGTVFIERSTGSPWVVYRASSSLRHAAWDAGLTTRWLDASLVSALDDSTAITGVSVSEEQVEVRVFVERLVSGGPPIDWRTRLVKVSGTQGSLNVTNSANWMRSITPAAKAFAHNGRAYCPMVVTRYGMQPTYFLVDEDSTVVAKYAPNTAGASQVSFRSLPESFSNENRVTCPATVKDRIEVGERSSNQSYLFAQTGVVSFSFDFDVDVSHAVLGESLHLSGGMVWQYDGVGVVEHGFHFWPDSVSVSLGASGALSAGTYSYVACYAWTDANGITHRSAPSIPVRVTASSGQRATVTIPTLHTTSKQARSPVTIEVYRTQADGTILYRVSSTTSPTLNSATALTVAFTDSTVSDNDLIGRPRLYTQILSQDAIPVLENIPPGPVSSLTVHRNRLVALDSTDPLRVWFSKETPPGSPVEFSDTLVHNIDPRGGDVTAISSLDDKLIVFKKSSVFAVTGQGPVSTGEGSDYSDAQLVTTDCGAVTDRSLALIPDGLVFQSSKGIYLLSRGLAASYIGADVERLVQGAVVTSSELLPTVHQVRFTLDSGIALVFDYLTQQWSSFTNVSAVDATIWQDRHVYLHDGGSVRRETPGVYTDDGAFIKLKLATSHLAFAGLAGFQRVWRLNVLGERESAGKLRVGLAYDYEKTPSQYVEIEPAADPNYGDTYDFGAGQVYGGEYPLFMWRVFPTRQKCSALQVTLGDLPPSEGDPGEGMSLSAIAFELGIQQGNARRPAAATAR